MVSFIVQVLNRLGVPVLMIGNSNALSFIMSELRLARRSAGLAMPHWTRFEANQPEWKDLFLPTLWKYQYLKQYTPLDKDLAAMMYKQTQGIPDYAVKLYEAVQEELMNDDKTDPEIITPAVIERVRRERFALSWPIIEALVKPDTTLLRSIPDIHPIDIFGPLSPLGWKGWPRGKVNGDYERELIRLQDQRDKAEALELPLGLGEAA
jgi:hypothetical protein